MIEGVMDAKYVELHLQGPAYLFPLILWSNDQKGVKKAVFTLLKNIDQADKLNIALLRIREPFFYIEYKMDQHPLTGVMEKLGLSSIQTPLPAEAEPVAPEDVPEETDDPVKNFIKDQQNSINLLPPQPSSPLPAQASSGSFNIFIEKVEIMNGYISYSLLNQDQKEVIALDHLELQAGPMRWPLQSQKTVFNLTGTLLDQGKLNMMANSQVKGAGWVNFYQREMESKISLQRDIKDILLEADLKAHQNKVRVDGYVRLSNVLNYVKEDLIPQQLVAQGRTENSEGVMPPANINFKGRFSFETDLEDFKIPSISFSGDFSEGEE